MFALAIPLTPIEAALQGHPANGTFNLFPPASAGGAVHINVDANTALEGETYELALARIIMVGGYLGWVVSRIDIHPDYPYYHLTFTVGAPVPGRVRYLPFPQPG